jgi:hypothetical protein
VTSKSPNGLVLRIVIELLAAAVTAFVLLAFAAPMLMDIRSNLAFWSGVGCWPLAGLIVVLAVFQARRDLKELRRLRGASGRLVGPL